MKILHIAAYHFFTPEETGFPEDLQSIRPIFKEKCVSLDLKGTILLASEGFNVSLAGSETSIEEFLSFLENETKVDSLIVKRTWADRQPFTRMLVKAKEQIIPVREEGVEPGKYTGPHISPKEFKKWYDEGKDMIVLDTRNDYEIRVGTFKDAVDLDLKHFRDFGSKLDQLSEEDKEKPVVMFCTGGIRCEKASPVMEAKGFKNVYQLDGGILNYFKEVGGEHYEGDCFVFDRRVALNSKLEETDAVECFNCRNPVTPEEQVMNTFKFGLFCPHCHSDHIQSAPKNNTASAAG